MSCILEFIYLSLPSSWRRSGNEQGSVAYRAAGQRCKRRTVPSQGWRRLARNMPRRWRGSPSVIDHLNNFIVSDSKQYMVHGRDLTLASPIQWFNSSRSQDPTMVHLVNPRIATLSSPSNKNVAPRLINLSATTRPIHPSETTGLPSA
jgi:hypothetical protein